MKNFVQPGKTIPLVAPAAVSSGDVVEVGSQGVLGIATADAALGESVECSVEGVFDLPKDGSAYAQGDLAYWDGSTVVPTDGGGANSLLGAVVAAAAGGDDTARVRLNGSFR